MNDPYWNDINSRGLEITEDEYWDWFKKSSLLDEWNPYHDFVGNYEHVCHIRRDGYDYHLTDFSITGKQDIVYLVKRIRRSPNQDGEGI